MASNREPRAHTLSKQLEEIFVVILMNLFDLVLAAVDPKCWLSLAMRLDPPPCIFATAQTCIADLILAFISRPTSPYASTILGLNSLTVSLIILSSCFFAFFCIHLVQ